MSGMRKQGEKIRQFILDNVKHHPKDITTFTADTFSLSRQAVNKHIQYLVNQNALTASGATRNRHYLLHPLVQWERIYSINKELEEDIVWRKDIATLLGAMPDNILEIWQYGVTEILNNAIDHSAGENVSIQLEKTAAATTIIIYDNGEGIFKKIQRELGLHDESHAVLELSKGKLTTDPERHTGEGIFFASRMFDDFAILSGNVFFSHKHDEIEDWILEHQKYQTGTVVFMTLANSTTRTIKQIFDDFTSGEDYGFTKTVVPVRLAQYVNESLISRSQAKRLLARVDKFKVVILDFDGVETIGQAFADEVFRVFPQQNPGIELTHIKTNNDVLQMIKRITKPLRN